MKSQKENMDTLVEQLNKLKASGYTEDFFIKEDKVITVSGKRFTPEKIVIKATYRFEGESNPADSSDLFAVEGNDGTKGTLVAPHGPTYSQNDEVIKKIKIEK